MLTRERVEEVLDKIRPALQRDGGNVEVIEIVGNSVKVRLVGHCVGCPSSMMTLHYGLEQTLRAEIPDFENLIPVSPWE